MRLMRLCETEGRMDIGAFVALREDVSLAEALEIEAALCVIGDQRAEFAEFYRDNGDAPAGAQNKATATIKEPTADSLAEELAYREERLQSVSRSLMLHRQAVAFGASGQPEPPGRLAPHKVKQLEDSLAANSKSVQFTRDLLEKCK